MFPKDLKTVKDIDNHICQLLVLIEACSSVSIDVATIVFPLNFYDSTIHD